MLGENNPNWKNSGLKKCKRCGVEFKSYNKARVFCSKKCSNESKIGIPLPKSNVGIENIRNAHHIKEWAKFPNERYNLGNGLTLCVDCHHKEHGWIMKPKIRIQYELFKNNLI